ncbi:hypothetical protein E2C01_033380 [Portunus trituberculatus]|uniref:Uncharacterized protein n=1 Tax=Portunus trituberculatus TaxID=210409 RepID=A0A5B7EYJ0_PORTR|nr:hypothetical protein [Portunus trituberculatus]
MAGYTTLQPHLYNLETAMDRWCRVKQGAIAAGRERGRGTLGKGVQGEGLATQCSSQRQPATSCTFMFESEFRAPSSSSSSSRRRRAKASSGQRAGGRRSQEAGLTRGGTQLSLSSFLRLLIFPLFFFLFRTDTQLSLSPFFCFLFFLLLFFLFRVDT